jgi:hypothetical protein
MDPNPKDFPVLAYVLYQLDPTSHPPLPPHLQEALLTQLPYLNHPRVLASLAQAIPDLTQRQSLLPNLGQRPDPSAVAVARAKLAEIQSKLQENEGIAVVNGVVVERVQKEKEVREVADTEMQIYKAVVRLEEMHEEFEKLLREAEDRLVEIYGSIVGELEEVISEEVVGILKEAESGVVERVELCGRQLRFLPEAFGKLHALLVLNLSHNQLEVSANFGSIKPLKNRFMLNFSYFNSVIRSKQLSRK